VNNSSSSKTSQTDWERIHAMSDEDIDLSDIPEVTETQMARAVLRVGGVPVDRSQQSVVMLESSIIEYFKRQAGNQDYQALIKAALTDYIRRNPLPTQSA
jgi:uncharacterized protein (DUF4415 family)